MINNSPRFDIVVANHNRIEIFWESFYKIKNFNPTKDRIVIMDCSDKPQKELEKSLRYFKKYKLDFGKNVLTIERRNWNLNHGAQLDYIRCISKGIFKKPRYAYFIQDHYLNTKKFVNEDTLPDREVLDLDRIERKMLKNKKMVWFCSRKGFRVSARFTDSYDYYRTKTVGNHMKFLKKICLVVDGGNFCVDPEYYLHNYKKDRKLYVKGIGTSFFCQVWETRLCKILYDRRLMFHDQHRNLSFSTLEDLVALYPKPGKEWEYFYNAPIAYFLHGQDIYKSNFKISFLYHIITEFRKSLLYDRNTDLKLLFSKQ